MIKGFLNRSYLVSLFLPIENDNDIIEDRNSLLSIIISFLLCTGRLSGFMLSFDL